MKFDNEKYKQEWKKANMLQVKAAFKADFVKDFREACDLLNIKQSDVIRQAMIDTINYAKSIS